MRAKEFSLFPLLGEKQIQQIGFRIQRELSFFYNRSGDREFFNVDRSAGIKALGGSGWDPDEDDFGITASYLIKNPILIFGPRGIVCRNATLGLALIWKSQDSRQRGVVPIGEFTRDSTEKVFEICHSFPKSSFRGRLTMDIVMYLKCAGIPGEDETHLSNIPGTIFGTLDSSCVLFDGTGAIFQFNEVADKNGLLWSVICDFDDATCDSFYDSVEIDINPLHPNYKYLARTSTSREPEMLREVLSSAMTTVVLSIRQKCSDLEWSSIESGKVEKGSVGDMMHYLVNKLNVDTSSPEKCSECIRRIMEKVAL